MTLKNPLALGISAVLLAGAGFAAIRSQSLNQWQHLLKGDRIILSQKEAWIVHEPRLVVPSSVIGMVFWKDGREGIFAVLPNSQETDKVDLSGRDSRPKDKGALHFVDLKTGSTKFRVPLEAGAIGSVKFAGKSEILFVSGYSYHDPSYLVDPESRTVLPAINDVGDPMAIPTETKGVAGVVFGDSLIFNGIAPVMNAIALYDFRTLPPTLVKKNLPKEANDLVYINENYDLVCRTESGGFLLNIFSGAIKQISQSEWDSDSRISFYLNENHKSGPLKISNLRNPYNELWVSASEGARKDVLISREASKAIIDKQGRRVLYTCHGAGFVATISAVNPIEAEKMVIERAKRSAEWIANLAKGAVQEYAEDHDQKLPLPSESSKRALNKYTVDPFEPESIVWTNLHGQNISQIEDSIPFELGYVPCPGGRFKFFLNSAVQWVPDSSK